MEIKIFHSFWSSLLYVLANGQTSEFGMFVIFILAVTFMGLLLGYRYSLYVQTKDFSPFLVWRASSTLILCFISLANELTLSILVVTALAISFW